MKLYLKFAYKNKNRITKNINFSYLNKNGNVDDF